MAQGVQVASLFGTLDLEDNFSDKLNSILGNATKDSGNMFTRLGGQFLGLGLQVTAATAPITAAVGAGISSFVKWEDAFADVLKTVDFEKSGFTAEFFSNQLRDLATNGNKATSSLQDAHLVVANVAALGGQLGITNDNLYEFTESMTMMGVATNLSADQAAMLVAQYANITGLPQNQIDNFSSALVYLGNNSATTERDIMNMSLRIAAAGNLADFTDAQILGLSTAMASVGIKAEAGGSAMTRILNEIAVAAGTSASGMVSGATLIARAEGNIGAAMEDRRVAAMRMEAAQDRLNRATSDSARINAQLDYEKWAAEVADIDKEINGLRGSVEGINPAMEYAWSESGDKLKVFADLADMTATDFAKLWKDDAPAALEKFIDGLGGLDQAAQMEALDALGLDGIRVSDVLRRLAEGTLDLSEIMGNADDAFKSNTALQEEAYRKSRTLGGSFRRLQNTVFDLAVGFGEKLAPTVATLVDKALGFINVLRDWVDEHGELIAKLAPAILAISGLGAALLTVGAIFSMVGAGIGAIGTMIGMLFGPIGAVVAVIGLLYLAFKNNLFGIADQFRMVWTVIKSFLGGLEEAFIKDGIGGVVKKLPRAIKGIWTAFKIAFENIWEKFSAWWGTIDWGEIGRQLQAGFGLVVLWAMDALAPLRQSLINLFNGVGDWLSRKWNEIWSAIGSGWGHIGDALAFYTGKFGEWARGLMVSAGQWLLDGFRNIGSAIGKWVAENLFAPLANALFAWGGVWDNAKEIGKAILIKIAEAWFAFDEWINEKLFTPLKNGLNAWGGVWDNAKTIGRIVVMAIGSAWTGMVSWVDEKLLTPISNGLAAWGGVWDNAKAIGEAIKTKVAEAWAGMTTWVDEKLLTPISTGLGAWSGVWDNALAIGNAIKTKIEEAWTGITEWVNEKLIDPIKAVFNGDIDWAMVATQAGNIVLKMAEGIVSGFGEPIAWVKTNIIDKIVNGLRNVDYAGVVSRGVNIAFQIGKGIRDWFLNIVSWVKTNIVDKIADAIRQKLNDLLAIGQNMGINIMEGIRRGVGDLGQWVKNKINEALGIAPTATNEPWAAGGITGKPGAIGGTRSAGEMSLVGERGMELFVPNQNGNIIKSDDLRNMMGGGGTTYNINVQVDPSILAKENLDANATAFGQMLAAALEGMG